MANAKSAHLESLVSGLDQLLFAGFVISYILDGNLLGLVIRCISQLQFSAPKTHHPDRSLRFQMTACGLINGLSILYHLGVPLPRSPRGVIIDFIGQSYIPNRLQMLAMDLIVAFMQALLVILAYETGHYGEEADFDDTSRLSDGEEDEDVVEAEETGAHEIEFTRHADENPSKTSNIAGTQEAPVINLRVRHTLRRILRNKPVSAIQTGPASPTSIAAGTPHLEGTALTRLYRMRARLRQRARELGTASSQGVPDRVDEGSDEEREVGLSSPDVR